MRLGFITQLLWHRYGMFWTELFKEFEFEPVFATEEAVVRHLSDTRVQAIPGLAFQLAAAQALALQEVDTLFAPDLNPGEDIPRGSGQDPWVASFPETLASSVGGLPLVTSVPAVPTADFEARATQLLLTITHDAARSRRALERHRSRALPARLPKPRFNRIPGEMTTVGIVGQPWLLTPKVLGQVKKEGVHAVAQSAFEPASLREEGWRLEERLVASDAETLGAARLLARRGTVDSLLFIADGSSGADMWLEARIRKLVHKDVETVYLQDVVSRDSFIDILLI